METAPRFSNPTGYSGSLLVAHPALKDPNFHKTVILLPVHSEEGGALGVVLNRPTGKTLGEMYPEHAFDKLADIKIYQGGPVENEQLILTAWKWDAEESSHKMFFGITSEHALQLIEEDEPVVIRAYLGYAGWTAGQLEAELASQSWIARPLHPKVLDQNEKDKLWDELVEAGETNDVDDSLPPPPEDPELN